MCLGKLNPIASGRSKKGWERLRVGICIFLPWSGNVFWFIGCRHASIALAQ
jgi:hypothetical protein